jgi:hypothetical protein
MPLDAEPSKTGNVLLHSDGICEVLPNGMVGVRETVYTSHFATCPAAHEHRKTPTNQLGLFGDVD